VPLEAALALPLPFVLVHPVPSARCLVLVLLPLPCLLKLGGGDMICDNGDVAGREDTFIFCVLWAAEELGVDAPSSAGVPRFWSFVIPVVLEELSIYEGTAVDAMLGVAPVGCFGDCFGGSIFAIYTGALLALSFFPAQAPMFFVYV